MTNFEMLTDLVDELGAEAVLRALRYEVDCAVGAAVSCASMVPIARPGEYTRAREIARTNLAHLGSCINFVKNLETP